MPFNHLILCHPLLLLPSIFPSIEPFQMSQLCIRWPKYWSFSSNISSSNEHPGMISFRMHWLDLLAVQGTLTILLQHHSSKASILQCSAFFIVQMSHPYMTIGKTIALTRQTFVGKVMSLLLNTLSRMVISFLPRSKCLLISWLQSPTAVILEPHKIKSLTVLWRVDLLEKTLIWVWVNSGSWWWTGRPGVLWFMRSQELDTTERLNWLNWLTGPAAMILVFWILSFKPTFSLSSCSLVLLHSLP